MNDKGGSRRKTCNPTWAETLLCKRDKHLLLKLNSVHQFVHNLNTKMAKVMDTGLGGHSSFPSASFQAPVYGFSKALGSA
jgi:hypothetical protein